MEFFRKQRIPNPRSASEFVGSLESETVKVEKVCLIPSFVCGSDNCTDGVYSQAEWSREYRSLFAQFGTLNPNCDLDVKKELERQYSKANIAAIKLHPVHHWFKPNSYRKEEGSNRRLHQIYQFAEDNSLPVMIHTGTSLGDMSRNKYGEPILSDDVTKDFPKLKIILTHAGRPFWYAQAFFLARSYDNVYLELAGVPPKRVAESLPRLGEILDKVIYGSDFPNVGVHSMTENAKEFAGSVTKDKRVMGGTILSLIRT